MKRKSKKTETIETSKSEPGALSPQQFKIWMWVALILLLLTYLLRLDRVVGLYGDDSWYVLLAKSLATGQGYTLINSPSANLMPLYPPGFSFLLSLVWRVYGQFPQNLWLLKSLSIAAMFGTGIVTYVYFGRVRDLPKPLSFALACAVVSSPAYVFLATSTVMSECVFTLAQLLVVLVVERCVSAHQDNEAQASGWRWALLGGALASLAFLTRSAALGLLVAAMLYLALQRAWRSLAVFVVSVGICVGPWMLYSRAYAPTPEQQAEQNSYIVQSYAQSFWQKKASYTTEGNITLGELPNRIWENAYHLLEYDFGALVAYPMYRAIEPSEGRLRYWWHDWFSLLVSAVILVGFFSAFKTRPTLAEWMIIFTLAIVVVWPFRPFRFVLPLLPWVLFYLLQGVRVLINLAHRVSVAPSKALWPAASTILGAMLLVNLSSNALYITTLHGTESEHPRWVKMFRENERLIEWMGKNISHEFVITAQNPALIYLYTGHKTVGSTEPAKHWEQWKNTKVRYFGLTSYAPLNVPPESEKRFKELYRLPDSNFRVIDFGDAATRPAWPE